MVYSIFFATVVVLFLGFQAAGVKLAHAATGNGAGFTMTPVYPKNQIGGESGAFKLLVKPGQTQDIVIRVVNQRDKARTIRFGINTSYTTAAGEIAYDLAGKYLPSDSTRKVSLASLVQSPQVQSAKIEPNQTGFLTFKLKIPDRAFSGVLLGGIYAMPVGETNTTTAQDGTKLRNEFGMALPITLLMNQNYKDPINLRLNTIRPGIVNNTVGIQVNVQNINPQFANKKLNIQARVTKKGSTAVLHSKSVSMTSFAPNSNYEFGISWGGKPLEPGKYHLSWKSDIGGVQNWNFERDFTITNAQAQNLNNQAGFKPNYLWLWILLGVLVLVLVIIVTYFIGRKRSQKNAQSANSGTSSRRVR